MSYDSGVKENISPRGAPVDRPSKAVETKHSTDPASRRRGTGCTALRDTDEGIMSRQSGRINEQNE